MKSIQQNVPVWFVCPEPQDIASMVYLMHSLKECITGKSTIHIDGNNKCVQQAFEVLKKMGFYTAIPEETLPAPPETVIVGEQQLQSNETLDILPFSEAFKLSISATFSITMRIEYMLLHKLEVAKVIHRIFMVPLQDAKAVIDAAELNNNTINVSELMIIGQALSGIKKTAETLGEEYGDITVEIDCIINGDRTKLKFDARK